MVDEVEPYRAESGRCLIRLQPGLQRGRRAPCQCRLGVDGDETDAGWRRRRAGNEHRLNETGIVGVETLGAAYTGKAAQHAGDQRCASKAVAPATEYSGR